MNENRCMQADEATFGRPSGFAPRLAYYHPNARGTGCAMKLERIPATREEEGCFMATLANQLTIGDMRSPNPTYPRFDWEGSIVVKLGFSDLCQILQVLRGECESIGDGRGLFHQTPRAVTRIVLRHMLEPVSGYSLETYRTPSGGGEEGKAHILISQAEAVGLESVISGSLALVCFGVPEAVAAPARGAGSQAGGVRAGKAEARDGSEAA